MAIQDNISADYLAQYNIVLGVTAVEKINSFPYLQVIAYNAILGSITKDFLGLNDWAAQIALYSATNNAILTPAFNAIKNLVPLNTEVSSELILIPGLGEVGDVFESLPGFAAAFSISGAELTSPSSISQKASNFS